MAISILCSSATASSLLSATLTKFCYIRTLTNSMEVGLDEGDVPMLVDAAKDASPPPDPLSLTLDDLSLIKVPITIVTGMLLLRISSHVRRVD